MMKWWGWGDAKITFPMEHKPTLWPWIKMMVGLKDESPCLPIKREAIRLDAPQLNDEFISRISKFLRAEQIQMSEDERLLHAYGKSYPDLYRVRKGIVTKAPDAVLLPTNHEEVVAIMKAAHDLNVCVVPFGGGTNIVGCVNPEDKERRMIATIDLRDMNKLLHLDKESRTATIQAGAIGPKLEKDLQALGYSLGHYPDSFEYSTLGGWIATRSAGMQSDAYGKIEDMVVSLKMVSPAGEIQTRTVPASSAGPDLNRLITGSEGTLGVITEATMRVHRNPAVKDYRGFLFKSFPQGVAAIQECLELGYIPSMIRLQDEGETQLALNMKSPKKGFEAIVTKIVKKILIKRGYTAPCIMIIGFEGEQDVTGSVCKKALKVLKKYEAFSLGASVGKTWSQDKFNVPYLRDYVMDYNCMVDVSETAATWKNVVPLHTNVINAVKGMFAKEFGTGYVGCHISHTYQTGACLYFTYGAKQIPGKELEQYYQYKTNITNTIMASGGTVSHHHAIGTEHRPWMRQEIGEIGVGTLWALKNYLDPKSICNPGKLIPDQAPTDSKVDMSFVSKAHEASRGQQANPSVH